MQTVGCLLRYKVSPVPCRVAGGMGAGSPDQGADKGTEAAGNQTGSTQTC